MREEAVQSSAAGQIQGAANGCGSFLNGCGSFAKGNGCGSFLNGCGSFVKGRSGATPVQRAWAAARVALR